jgi:hypothetical protein
VRSRLLYRPLSVRLMPGNCISNSVINLGFALSVAVPQTTRFLISLNTILSPLVASNAAPD